MITDHYNPAGVVCSGANAFFAVPAHEGFECLPYKRWVRKPVG